MKDTRQKITQVVSALFVLGLLAALLVVGALTVVREKDGYSYFENRNLAQKPEAVKETLLDGTYFTQLERFLAEQSAGRKLALKAETYLNMFVLKRPVVNEVVLTDELLLPWNNFETVDEAALDAQAEEISDNLKKHADLVQSYGGAFYYVAVPCQYVYFEEAYPQYLNSRAEYTEKSSAALFSKLREKGVSFIDLKAEYEALGKPASFYSTVDNHYSIFGAFEAYRIICEAINRDTDLNIRILQEGDYTITELPNRYLGSRNRKLFGLRDSDEKLAILTPNEDIPFRRYNYENDNLVTSLYQLPESPEADALYTVYMGGDIAITELYTDRPELPNFLIYGDSFTNAVEDIIWTGFNTMITVDFRHYSTMTLDALIEKYRPDIVVCIRDYEALLLTEGNGQ